jgi:hypothetical protein
VSFLAPIFLVLTAAAAVPLLVHLLRRRMDTRIEFPAARYLARAERENSRRLRLRNLLLMLLRVAAVVLVALAAARPVGRLAGTGHAPTALGLVLDNSLSTSAIHDGRPILERLKDAAREVIASASAADAIWLVTADGQVTGGSPGAVGEALERVRALAGAGAVGDAVERASMLVGASALGERRIGILTDGQATSWTRTTDVGDRQTPVLVFAPPASAALNRAVVMAEARPTRWTPRGETAARIATSDSASYRVMLGERSLARGTIAPGEEVLVRAAPAERGWLAGRVELQADELRGDDVRYFAVSVGPPPGVRVAPGVGPFVRSAVDALMQGERVVPGSDVTIVAADELTVLPALIVAPSDPLRVGAANRALERAGVPWRLGAVKRTPSIARGVDDAQWDSARVSVAMRYGLEPRRLDAIDTIATAAGEPWIVAGERYVIVGSPIDPDATDLPIRALFVPWLAETVTQHLAGAGGGLFAVRPSATVRRPGWASALESPDGHRATLTGPTFTAPDRSGVFFLLRGTERAGAVVVNGEPSESDLRRLDDATLRSRIQGDEVEIVNDGARWSRAMFGTADRRPLAVPFLILAVGALIAESALAGTGGRRGS